jgi:hypothetical protein
MTSNFLNKSRQLSRDAARKAAKDADDLEAAALQLGAGVSIPLDESIYDQEISEEEAEAIALTEAELEAEDLDVDAIQAALTLDTESEQLISAAAEVVKNRQQLLGDAYPFRLEGNRFYYAGSRSLVYELCLAIANVNVSFREYKPLQTAFERLAGVAVASVLGPGFMFLRTGFPPAEDVGGKFEPESFERAIEMLRAEMPGEWVLDANTKMKDPNDGGLDVVVWKRLDSREGSIMYVGNCGCGKNWLKEGKHRERPSSSLERILSRPKPHHVHDFFSLPFHVYEGRDWDDASTEGRLVLDRIRLALVAEAMSSSEQDRMERYLSRPVSELIAIADPRFKPSLKRID